MSVYETSITNPKKQLEFYKDLSEQLEKENQELKKQLEECSVVADTNSELADYYKEVIDKVIELLGNYKHYSTPSEKQNSDNENLVNKAFDLLKEVG